MQITKIPDLPNFKEDYHYDIRTRKTFLRFYCNYSKKNTNRIRMVCIVSVIHIPISQLIDENKENAKRKLWRYIGAI